MPDEERNQEPTAHRREQARRRGQVCRSREVGSSAVLLAGLFVASATLPSFAHRVQVFTAYWLQASGRVQWTEQSALAALGGAAWEVASLLGLPLLALAVVSIAVNGLQTGFLASLGPLAPRWERINPAAGAARIFSRRALFEAARSLAKAVLFGWIAWTACTGAAVALCAPGAQAPLRLVAIVHERAGALAWRVAVVSALLAVLDYLYQRYDYERTLRMTRQEVRDDHRQTQGDPRLRSRIRERQRRMSSSRMMANVPRSDVVLANPEHVAVALIYREGRMRAPRVTAKGAEAMARRIREVARRHGVPILERRDLARALYASVEVGDEIPRHLYEAVAHVVAWLYDLQAAPSAEAGDGGNRA